MLTDIRALADHFLIALPNINTRQPSWHILTYKGYKINGNTFYTLGQDKKRTNQNSGVRVDATDPNGNRQTYYGHIEEIWEHLILKSLCSGANG